MAGLSLRGAEAKEARSTGFLKIHFTIFYVLKLNLNFGNVALFVLCPDQSGLFVFALYLH